MSLKTKGKYRHNSHVEEKIKRKKYIFQAKTKQKPAQHCHWFSYM